MAAGERRMQAVVLGDRGIELTDARPWPELAPEEALVRVSVAGICGTDLELAKGYAEFRGVLGHEMVGVVEDSPDRRWLERWRGRRVVAGINVGCGDCSECVDRGAEHCARRQVIGIRDRDGCFAEYLSLPCANLYAVTDEITTDAAVFSEPLAAAIRVTRQVDLDQFERVAVVGPGRLGLLTAMVLALEVAARPLVVGRSETSLELPSRLGLDTVREGEASSSAYDLVVDATGAKDGLREALRLVRPGGTVVLKSTFAGRLTIDPADLVVPEVRLVGSRCGPIADSLELLRRHRLDPTPLIDARYPLERAEEALLHAAQPGIRKVLLDI